MKKLRIPIAGLYSKTIYTAICNKALTDNRIVFVVAENQRKLVGLVIAIIDRNRFLVSFLIKHPILALQIFFIKFLILIKARINGRKPNFAQMEYIKKYIKNSPSKRSWWKDSSPEIAKAVFISVVPEYRGRKIGLKLNRYRDEILVRRGVERYDGIVELHRIPQIRLLYKTGFYIERKGPKLFVSKDL